jgi:hypothetical protein
MCEVIWGHDSWPSITTVKPDDHELGLGACTSYEIRKASRTQAASMYVRTDRGERHRRLERRSDRRPVLIVFGLLSARRNLS